MYRSFAAKRGISLPARRLGQVEGVLPVPRGRHRAAAADVRVGDVPRRRPLVRGRRSRSSPASTSSSAATVRPREEGARNDMRCDVLAIGTELLLGQIVDTNSSWIGEQLAAVGIDTCEHRKVGDNLDRMVQCLRELLDRADAVDRVRWARPDARRRDPRGDRRGHGRRARAARGADRADPRHLRRPRPAVPGEQPPPGRRAGGRRRHPEPDRHRARAAVRGRCGERREEGRLRGPRRALRDDRDGHRARAARSAGTRRASAR